MYAPAMRWRSCASSAMVMFLQAIIAPMLAAGFGELGSGLQPVRSDSLALRHFRLPLDVSAYTVTARFSVWVFSNGPAVTHRASPGQR